MKGEFVLTKEDLRFIRGELNLARTQLRLLAATMETTLAKIAIDNALTRLDDCAILHDYEENGPSDPIAQAEIEIARNGGSVY